MFLCVYAVFMKFAYDSHTFPQFMIVIWRLDTVIQYYLKSNKVFVKFIQIPNKL